MIVVKVELHSAITGKVSVLGQAVIANDGTGTKERGNYWIRLFGKDGRMMKQSELKNWPRKSKHVWALIARLLQQVYGEKTK